MAADETELRDRLVLAAQEITRLRLTIADIADIRAETSTNRSTDMAPTTTDRPVRDIESCEECGNLTLCSWHDGFREGVQAQAEAVRKALDADL